MTGTRRVLSGRWMGVCAAAVVLATALPAAGQASRNQGDVAEPPRMGNVTNNDSPLPRIGIAIFMSMVVIGVNLIPSKRGHQD